MGKSFQLIRTNPRLTTNYKIVISNNDNLYLESFNSTKELSDDKYKHYLLSIDAMLENEIPKFYDGLPKNIAFKPKSDNDVDVMYDTYEKQFDETYFSGADEIEDAWYTEEFEYFAPLYITKNELPSNFIIMRINDPNIYEKTGSDYTIGTLNKDNFREEIIDKWKCISVFDLSNETNIGKFFDRNINNNDRFPDFSFFFDTKKYNYSKWAGLEYKSGVYRTSELFLDDKLFYENPHFNLEEFITNGFQENGIIYPYILNLKFLFDDNPATPNKFLKYTMNRYYGFYTDNMELVKTITSYNLPELKSNINLKNNIFLNNLGDYINPFVNEYIKNDWIQVDNNFYEVRQQVNGSFKIISDKNISYSSSDINNGFVLISNNNISDFGNIDEYISLDNTKENMYADLYLIEINGEYHVLKNDYTKSIGVSGETIFTNNYTIQTDYSISSNNDILNYYKGGQDNEYHIQKEVVGSGGSPLGYNIYRVKLSNIKDFDFDRINTSYSDFDYEKSTYVNTLEEKLHAKEYRDNSVPKRNKLHSLNQDGQYSLMNISSEYTAGDETFELRKNNQINPLWEKNQSICKWGYRGSISHSDYPYKINNSKEIGGVYNRTTNTQLKEANIKEKNLDYFYRIGAFYGAEDVEIDDASGFDIIWVNNWDTISGSWSWQNSLKWLEGTPGSILENNKISLTIGKDYYIYIRLNIIGGPGNLEAGIDPNSFDNMTTTIISQNIVLEGIRKANSETLRIIAPSTTVSVGFYEIHIYDITNRYYLNQSTNIQTNLFNYLDSSIDDRFNLNYYINSDFDYFDFFFRNIMYYEDYGKLLQKPYLKYATFSGGDNELPATALFKGIEYKIYKVEDIVLNSPKGSEETIRNIITQGGSNFNGYDMAVILSENYNYYSFDKKTIIKIDEDVVDSNFVNFTKELSGGTSLNFVNYNNLLQLSWITNEEPSGTTADATVKLTSEQLNTNDIYDVSITFSWDTGGYSAISSSSNTSVAFECNTFDTLLTGTLFTINYSGGKSTSGTETYSINGVNCTTIGEIEIDLHFIFGNCDSYDNSYVRIVDVNIDRYYDSTEYSNPQFRYSYNPSINGLLDNQDKNATHIYLNDKYKNMLVVINQNIPINIDWVSMNNIDAFGENYGLYYGKTLGGLNMFPVTGTTVVEYNPNKLTAFNYMDALNNLNTKGLFDSFVYYHYIDKDGNYAKTQMIKFGNSTYTTLPNWDEKYPPFIIEVDNPLDLELKKNSYIRNALNKPSTNITDKFLVFDNGKPLPQSIINEPLARNITINQVDEKYRFIRHGESLYQNIYIKRYVGYYEPIFKDIPMYRPIYYWKDGDKYFSVGDNYVFADNLEQFATINELMYSKVNDEYNVLKLKNTDNDRSVYPMVDEIGLSQTKRFIFLSSWDNEFFIKTLNETTFLEEFITTDLDDPTIPIYGQLVSVGVTNPDPYYSKMNIYGNLLGSGTLGYILNVKNLGTTPQVFNYEMKYISNLNLTGVLSGGTLPTLAPNETYSLPINYYRPDEQNFGVPYYEEFTTWKILFKLFDSNGNDLDSNDSVTFDVYNNLIGFTLSNPTVTGGFPTQHQINMQLDYSIDVDEVNNRLKNISYISELWMEISGGTDIYTLLSTINGTLTNSKTINFNGVNTPLYALDYNSTDTRKIKFEVYHEYNIEDDIKYTGGTYIVSPGLVVSRPPEPFKLIWMNQTSEPTFNMTEGGCNFEIEEYNGDSAENCTATIQNSGGTFNGTIRVYFYWRADATTIASDVVTWSGVLNKNDYHVFTTTIGPKDVNGNPYITYTNKDYTIKAICSQISGSITSNIYVGFNTTYPDCTV